MTKRRSLIVKLSVAAVVIIAIVAIVSVVATRSSHSDTRQDLRWAACTQEKLKKAGADCAMVEVPLDYGNPDGKKISLAISRIKAKVSDEKKQGVMLVNPGGPGGSGLGRATLGTNVPGEAGDTYDWIGFDPRGVGDSKPSIACDPTIHNPGRPDYVPTSDADIKYWLDRSKKYADACAANAGDFLEHTKTADWAKDMDSIRSALGAKKINYYGYSYGTYLGQVYATLFPDRVRRMVWDGVVNADRVWYGANIDQDYAFDDNLHRYFDWLADNDSVYHLGTNGNDVSAKFNATYEALKKQPKGIVGSDEFIDVFEKAGYYVFNWDKMGRAMSNAIVNNDWANITELAEMSDKEKREDDNEFAMYNAVQCSDIQWPRDWQTWKQDAEKVSQKAPFLAWENTWYNTPCLTWHAKPGRPVTVTGKNVPPVLLIAETHDAATPFSGALATRKKFGNSVLIEGADGTTHSGSLHKMTTCTDNIVARYLRDGELPPRSDGDSESDVKCAPVDPPEAK